MALGADFAGTGVAFALQNVRDGAVAETLVGHLEDAADDRRCVGIGLERAEPDTGDRLGPLWVRMFGVHDAIAVVGPTTQPAAGRAVREHRVAGPGLQPAAFSLGESSEQAHQHLVALAIGIDAATEFRDPQVDAVMGELREHELELPAREGALGFGDDECGPTPASGSPRQSADVRLPGDGPTATRV